MSYEGQWQGPLQPGEKPPVEDMENKNVETSHRDISKPEDKKSEDVENVEKELSPEVIEMIMDKVQDINSNGVAFSVVNAYGGMSRRPESLLRDIFSEGLLGSSYSRGGFDFDASKNLSKKIWAKETKDEGKSVVHFNIVGRMSDVKKIGSQIARSNWVENTPNPIVLIFKLDTFTEDYPINSRSPKNKLKTMAYRANLTNTDKKYFEKNNSTDSSAGFMLSHRVAPRFLQGMALGFLWEKNSDFSNLHFLKIAKERIQSMKNGCGEKLDKLVPVYDLRGNLHWPKHMPYEEVKRFVAERDAKKVPHPNPLPKGEGE